MLNVKKIYTNYGDMQILHGVSLEIQKGEIVSIVGANAAGKSTLISSISGIVPIVSGSIEFEERRIDCLSPFQRVEVGIVHVPEGRRLFSTMTLLENLELGAYSREAREKRAETLRMVYEFLPELERRKNQLAGSLSGGQQQMCAIGRGLMARPKLMMLDEPSLGLAPLLVQDVFSKIQQINAQGTMILLVEQNVHHALALSHRGYVLESGKVGIQGPGKDLLNNELLKKAYMGR